MPTDPGTTTETCEPVKRRPRALRAVGIGCGVPLLLVALACGILWYLLSALLSGGEDEPGLGEVSRITRLSFPRGTTLLNSRRQWDCDYVYMWAKLEMPRDDVEAFIRTNPCGKVSRKDRLAFEPSGVPQPRGCGWWSAASVEDFVATQSSSWCYLALLLDTGGRERAVVYLYYER